MNETKRRSVVLIIIAIATLALVVGMATFAFFATGRDLDNGIINANVGTAASMYQFSATSNGNIEMDIKFNDMSQANVSENVLKTDNATIDVSLASPSDNMLTTCTYDIVWVWDSGDKYTTPDVTLPYTHTDNKVYNYEFSTKVDNQDETDLSNLPISENIVTLSKGETISSNSTVATKKTYTINANIYNLPVEQTNLFNKSFKAHVTINNLNCNMESGNSNNTIALADYIQNEVYNSEDNKLNTQNGSAGLYYHDASLANGAKDNTYRYAGKDESVNNYVCFEGDDCRDEDNLYRIISVDSNTNQIKVIKATSIGNMAWNNKEGYVATGTTEDIAQGLTSGTTYTNVWAIKKADGSYYTSSLNDYLNGEYLTSLGNKSNLIAQTTWSVAGASYSDDLNKKNVYDFMKVELSNKAEYVAKIGLMYASEYGYAALPEYWTNVLGYNSTNGYNLSKGNDWLLSTGYPWIISRYSDRSDYAFYLDFNTGLVSYVVVANAFRPSFNLTSSVKLVSGSGQSTDPYVIA